METRCSLSYSTTYSRSISMPSRNQTSTDIYALLKKKPSSPPQKDEEKEEEKEEEEERFYRCRACSNPIAHVGDEMPVGDIPVQTTQINPHGYVHEIFTVRNAFNVILHGTPVPADTWFPGYQWRYCFCQVCGNHLGWSYHIPSVETCSFFGLRRGSTKED